MPGNILSMLKCILLNNINKKILMPVQACGRSVVMHNVTLKFAKAVYAVKFIISVFIPHSGTKLETYVFMNLCQFNHFSLLHQKFNIGSLTNYH